MKKISIQPNLILEVLGVGVIDTNFINPPAPVMRYNRDADAYTFIWVMPAPDPAGPARLIAQKEVWYDRKTKLPKLVVLFDADGRVILRAILGKHKPLPVKEAPPETWPSIATDYQLYFPDTGSKMVIQLDDIALDKNGVPSRRGIVFPGTTPDDAGVREVIQLDK